MIYICLIIYEEEENLFGLADPKPEPLENIRAIDLQGDTYRQVYEERLKKNLEEAIKNFEEEAQKMDMDKLKKLCDELPGI